jgi:hypothetical protein
VLNLTSEDRNGNRQTIESADSFLVDCTKDGTVRISRQESDNTAVVGHFHSGWGRLVVGGQELKAPRVEASGEPLEIQVGGETLVSDSFALGFDGGGPAVRADARRVACLDLEDGKWLSVGGVKQGGTVVFQLCGAGAIKADKRGRPSGLAG